MHFLLFEDVSPTCTQLMPQSSWSNAWHGEVLNKYSMGCYLPFSFHKTPWKIWLRKVWLRVLNMPGLNHTLQMCQHKNASPSLFISNWTHSLIDVHELWAIHMSVEIMSLLSSISNWNLCLSFIYEHEQQIQ